MQENFDYKFTLNEELSLIELARKGNKDAQNQLFSTDLRIVTSIVKMHLGQGLSIKQLIEAGNKGLKLAIEKFDEKRGFKFLYYAIWFIKQSINQAKRDFNNSEY